MTEWENTVGNGRFLVVTNCGVAAGGAAKGSDGSLGGWRIRCISAARLRRQAGRSRFTFGSEAWGLGLRGEISGGGRKIAALCMVMSREFSRFTDRTGSSGTHLADGGTLKIGGEAKTTSRQRAVRRERLRFRRDRRFAAWRCAGLNTCCMARLRAALRQWTSWGAVCGRNSGALAVVEGVGQHGLRI